MMVSSILWNICVTYKMVVGSLEMINVSVIYKNNLLNRIILFALLLMVIHLETDKTYWFWIICYVVCSFFCSHDN